MVGSQRLDSTFILTISIRFLPIIIFGAGGHRFGRRRISRFVAFCSRISRRLPPAFGHFNTSRGALHTGIRLCPLLRSALGNNLATVNVGLTVTP
jgi:hypothetical protein